MKKLESVENVVEVRDFAGVEDLVVEGVVETGGIVETEDLV